MSTSNPTGSSESGDDANTSSLKHSRDPFRPPSLDPRSQSAIDNIGVDHQADLLDVGLDEQPGDRDVDGHSFAEEVRSDGNDDERNERR